MAETLSRYDVRVVALSNDSVDRVQFHQRRDGLKMTLLADPELKVIADFGLLHQKGAIFKTFFLLGIPLGYPIGFQRMAIPTTLLVDEEGVVRFIDQADDYRLRGDEERIAAALKSAFGVASASH